MRFVVTGGRGFIGSHFVEEALSRGCDVIDFDKMGYASHLSLPWDDNKNYMLIKKDIADIEHIPSCDIILNFAAESHVDNSIKNTDPFIKSNIIGVHNLLELTRSKFEYERPIFFHISTDEVYGDIVDGSFNETARLAPGNPYSATKAAAEMLVTSYSRTYGIDYLMTRSSNNYGERQHSEKLISKIIDCAKNNKKVPIHGDGTYIRDWLYVKDNVSAIFKIIESGSKNEIYNVSSNNYLQNLDVVDEVLSWFSKDRTLVKFVENRWGQDIRYSIDSSKLKEIGWSPIHTSGIFKWL